MTKNTGISLITLVVTIVVLLILASITMISGIGSIRETSKTQVDMEIRSIKDAVMDRMVENARNSSKYPLVGKKVEDITAYLHYIDNMSNDDIETFVKGINNETIDYYRVVDTISAQALGVEGVDEDHYFIVDYSTGSVYGSINMEAYLKDNPS